MEGDIQRVLPGTIFRMMGRFKHIHLSLMVGISLFIPLLLAYSLYVDLSATAFRFSDVIFEDSGDEDSPICQNEFKVFVPTTSSDPLSPWTHFAAEYSLRLSLLLSSTQAMFVLRC